MFQAIGLDSSQERIYRHLLTHRVSDVPTLAARLALPAGLVARALRRLERMGLVTGADAGVPGWEVLPPRDAIRALTARHRLDLTRAETEADRLAAEFRSASDAPQLHRTMELVVGAEALAARFRQLQLEAEREVCAFVSAQPTVVSGAENTAEHEAAARGVRYRVVVERTALARPDVFGQLRAALERGEEVRVVDRLPGRLLIADGAVAMTPVEPVEQRPAAFLVHGSALLGLLAGLFDTVWRQAPPLVLGRDDAAADADGVDRAVLSLMLTGHSDSSAAKQLGIGLRTLQRRVSRMMKVVGATNRLQLGWHAADRGWLTESGTRTTVALD